MLRIGSVFSGIGAAEHALYRMGISHSIEFACDNGGIVLEDIDYEKELQVVKNLSTAQEKKEYVEKLYKSKSSRKNLVQQTYMLNFEKLLNDEMFFQDIKLFDGKDFQEKIDIYIGGSPCQSFSIIGDQHGLADTRGTLFRDFIRIIQEAQPKVFIYENVCGMISHDKGLTFEIIQNSFKEIGYHFMHYVLDAKNYGIPQSRKRLFIVGFREQKWYDCFILPEAVPLTLRRSDLLLDKARYGGVISQKGMLKVDEKIGGGGIDSRCFLSQKLIDYVTSPGTKGFYHPNVKIERDVALPLLSTMGNTHRASVNNYTYTDGKIRALDPRETLRLMGFDDTYKLDVAKSRAYIQIGNSIVVDVLMALIREILKALENNEGGENN